MAIFYDRICGAKQEDNNPVYWTYLQFKSNDKLPHIHLSTNRITESLGDNTDYGQILVSGTENNHDFIQTIYTDIDFEDSSIALKGSSSIKFKTSNEISYTDNALQLSSQNGGIVRIDDNVSLTGNSISLAADSFSFQTKDKNTTILNITKDSLSFLTDKLIVSSNGNLTVPKGATIEAGSFNATSDARAKTNLTELAFSESLNFVNSTHVYTFNYKDSNEPSIGVLAQDLLKNTWFVNNFSLVDNIDATGEKGDYMSVKESKLVYVLWGAVQDLSKQIDSLRAEIDSLKFRG